MGEGEERRKRKSKLYKKKKEARVRIYRQERIKYGMTMKSASYKLDFPTTGETPLGIQLYGTLCKHKLINPHPNTILKHQKV